MNILETERLIDKRHLKEASRKYEKYAVRAVYQNSDASGSGCGSVGRVVASDTRGPRFESSHFILNILSCQLYSKDENQEKKAGNGQFF